MRAAGHIAQADAVSAHAPAERVAGPTRAVDRRRPRVLLLAVTGVALGIAVWQERTVPLHWLGAALVHEDPVRPADVVIVSVASMRGAALDAAKLYRRGLVREVWVPRWATIPIDRRLDKRGLGTLPLHEVARRILEGSGVPASHIVILDHPVDGLESEMAVVGAALGARPVTRPILLTARSHTARARHLLQVVYAPAAGVRIRAPHTDEFTPTGWWRDHGSTRELVLEYLKWFKLLTAGPSLHPDDFAR